MESSIKEDICFGSSEFSSTSNHHLNIFPTSYTYFSISTTATMPLRVTYNRDCDANFQRVYGTAFAAWAAVTANATHHGITFDQAEVL